MGNVRRILWCFEVVSGLKINVSKSCMVHIGKGKNCERNWAAVIKCTKGTLPITYLGLPLGGRLFSKSFWNNVIRMIENRMAP